MDIVIYDPQLKRVGDIDEYTSLLWTRKYYESGNFVLEMPVTMIGNDCIKRGNIVRKVGSIEAGVIEYIQKVDDGKKQKMTVKGRFLSSYMDRRIVKSMVTYSGTSEVVMREFLSALDDPLPLVELGELQGFADTVTKQVEYKSLLDVEKELSADSNHGFRFRPDFSAKKIYFEIYDGVNRSMSQRDNSQVIFSEQFANLNSIVYTESDSTMKTVCYVGGEEQNGSRTIITIGDDTLTGLARREMFVNAKSSKKGSLSDSEYAAVLAEKGKSKFEKKKMTLSFESKVDPNTNFVYKRDYDLGDIVTVDAKKWSIKNDLRITEIAEKYQGGGMVIELTFGDPIPTVDWRDFVNE